MLAYFDLSNSKILTGGRRVLVMSTEIKSENSERQARVFAILILHNRHNCRLKNHCHSSG